MSKIKPAFSDSSSFITRSSRSHVEKKKKYDRVITKAQVEDYKKEKALKKAKPTMETNFSLEGLSVVNSIDYKLEPFCKRFSSPVRITAAMDLTSLPIERIKTITPIKVDVETVALACKKKKYTEITTKYELDPKCAP